MQPSGYTLESLSVENIDDFDPQEGHLAMLLDYEPSISRNVDGVSYLLGLRLLVKDMPDRPAAVPYRIHCAGRCAFVSDGYCTENDKWVLTEGLKILYGLMSGSIGTITGQFENGSYVPPVFDLSEKATRLLAKLSK